MKTADSRPEVITASSSSTQYLNTEITDLYNILPVIDDEQITNVWSRILKEMQDNKPVGLCNDSLHLSYRTDLDIIHIHRQILLYFHHQYYGLSAMKLKLQYWSLKQNNYNYESKKYLTLEAKIKQTEATINDIESGTTLRSYLTKVLPYLQVYNQLKKKHNVLSFDIEMS